MSKRIAGVGLALALAVAPVSGCAADIEVDSVVASDPEPSSKNSPKPTFPSEVVDVDDEGTGVDDYDERYEKWLQSDDVGKLDLRKMTPLPLSADAPGDFESFEEAVDASSDVVSGEVTRIVLVPFGIVTFFKVDRKAKGDAQISKEIAVYQQNYVYPTPRKSADEPFGPPKLTRSGPRSVAAASWRPCRPPVDRGDAGQKCDHASCDQDGERERGHGFLHDLA